MGDGKIEQMRKRTTGTITLNFSVRHKNSSSEDTRESELES